MRIAMLSPVAWRTPPRHYGPWELVTSLLTEELVKSGLEVTLFATADSITRAKLDAVIPIGYEEDLDVDAKVAECMHISHCFERAADFDLIHNNFDFIPLTYSSFINTPILTTIHGFSSQKIVPVFKKYNHRCHYISISDSDRSPELRYMRTIYHGIDLTQFTFKSTPEDYLLYFGRIHPDKGTKEAIDIAKKTGYKLIMAGIIQDAAYFHNAVQPHVDNEQIHYIGSVEPANRNKILQNAVALLHPISFDEPFVLSVVEAMACGTPTIAYKRGSMPEIITSGVDGFTVESFDEAVEAVYKVAEINRYRCRKTAEERFSSTRMAQEYLNAYKSILKNLTFSDSAW